MNTLSEIPSTSTERRERKDRFYAALAAEDAVGDWCVELEGAVNGTEAEMREAIRWVMSQIELFRKECPL